MMALPTLYNDQVLRMEGIFRLAGDRGMIEELEREIDRAKFPNFYSLLDAGGNRLNLNNVHVVADIMKRSFKYMKDPLIPFSFYQSFISTEFEKSEELRIKKIKGLMQRLPLLNRILLEELFRFLNYAMQFSTYSKMTEYNLAIVFAPNVLRPEIETSITMMDTDNKNRVVSLIISKADEIFSKEEAPKPAPPPPSSSHHSRPPPPTSNLRASPMRNLPSRSMGGAGMAPPPKLSANRAGLPQRLPPKPK